MASLVSGQTSAPLPSIIHADRNHRRSYTPATSSKTALQLHSHPLYSSSSVSCFAASSCSCSSSSIGGVPFFVFSLLFLLLFNLFLYFSSSILFIVFICSSFSLSFAPFPHSSTFFSTYSFFFFPFSSAPSFSAPPLILSLCMCRIRSFGLCLPVP